MTISTGFKRKEFYINLKEENFHIRESQSRAGITSLFSMSNLTFYDNMFSLQG